MNKQKQREVIKQLQQECEELKKKIETYKCSTNCHKYIEADRYRKTFEEIEGLIQSTLDDFEEDDEEVQLSYCHNISLQILDIISKLKDKQQ